MNWIGGYYRVNSEAEVDRGLQSSGQIFKVKWIKGTVTAELIASLLSDYFKGQGAVYVEEIKEKNG